jgi:serine/threonine protein phosphatase 1
VIEALAQHRGVRTGGDDESRRIDDVLDIVDEELERRLRAGFTTTPDGLGPVLAAVRSGTLDPYTAAVRILGDAGALGTLLARGSAAWLTRTVASLRSATSMDAWTSCHACWMRFPPGGGHGRLRRRLHRPRPERAPGDRAAPRLAHAHPRTHRLSQRQPRGHGPRVPRPGGQWGEAWLRNGGIASLRSYDADPHGSREAAIARIPETHVEFMASLETHFQWGSYLVVHAGIRPGVPLAEQRQEDLLWIREEFLDHPHDLGSTVVFGHTPFRRIVVEPPYKIGIDTGCVYGGALTCISLPDARTFQIRLGDTTVLEDSLTVAARRRP